MVTVQAECTTLSLPLSVSLCAVMPWPLVTVLSPTENLHGYGAAFGALATAWELPDPLQMINADWLHGSGVATCCGLAPVRMIYLSIPPSWILPNFRPTKRRCRPFGSIWPMVRHVTDLWRPRRNLRNNDSSEGNRRTCRRFLARCQTTHRNRQGCF